MRVSGGLGVAALIAIGCGAGAGVGSSRSALRVAPKTTAVRVAPNPARPDQLVNLSFRPPYRIDNMSDAYKATFEGPGGPGCSGRLTSGGGDHLEPALQPGASPRRDRIRLRPAAQRDDPAVSACPLDLVWRTFLRATSFRRLPARQTPTAASLSGL